MSRSSGIPGRRGGRLLAPLEDLLHTQVHLFSTVITCVTGHMVENDIRRAAIITDGCVGPVPPQHRDVLRKRRTRLAVLLTDGWFTQLSTELGARNHLLPVIPATEVSR